MSNHLAIATVTAALGEVVYNAVKAAKIPPAVSFGRPGTETGGGGGGGGGGGEGAGAPRANIFLYSITPNPSWRNADLPTRRGDGALAQRPQAALDLHYLVSFYGSETTLEPQRMLGSVVRALHARPVLGPQTIDNAKTAHPVLADSNLEEAPEPVRFTPSTLNLEELSKLWSVLFQTPYALSVAYQGTVVLIDAEEEAPRPTLPVRGRNVYVVQLRRPEIERVEGADGPAAPILPDGTLVLRGRALAGEVTRVRLGTAGGEWEPTLAAAREVRLPLAAVPAAQLRAGIQGVQVIHRRQMGTPPVPHRGEESNVAPFVLRPVVRRKDDDPLEDEYAVVVLPPVAAGDPPRVQVKVHPLVGPRQRAELLLNEVADPDRPAFLYPDEERGADTDTLEFDAPGLGPGRYLVRVRIDGAESLLEADAPTPGSQDAVYARPWLEVA